MRSFYLNKIVYYIAGGAAVLYLISYFIPSFFGIGTLLLLLLFLAVLVDAFLIYTKKKGFVAERWVTDRFSIGDLNKVHLHLKNQYPFPVNLSVIDELPIEFQERNWLRKLRMDSNANHELEYSVCPKTRGEYLFGNINVYIHGPLSMVKRRYIFPAMQTVKVYPSYLQM